MRVKTRMGLERFEVDKTQAFSLDFQEIPEILEMGFSETFKLTSQSQNLP